MSGNGKIFVSHSHADNELCKPLTNALAAWGIDFWFDTDRLEAGQDLSDKIQAAIAARDVFIRVGTGAVLRRPYWVNLETNAFRALLAEDENEGRRGKRTLIPLVMDTYYVLQPFEKAHLYIDAARQPQEVWLQALRKALLPGHRNDPPQTYESRQSVIVDWQGSGHFTSLSRALKAAEDGQLILVQPGIYREHLAIEKRVTIQGDGEPGSIIVEAESADAMLSTSLSATVSNLSLKQQGGRGSWYGVDVRGGHLELRDCNITSQSLAGVAIHSGGEAAITRCAIHDCKQSGIIVYDSATAYIEENQIHDNALHGLIVQTSGQPTVRKNRILGNAENGIFVLNHGRGIYEDNQILHNRHSGVAVSSSGTVVLRGNQIHENESYGVHIYEGGGGVVEGNDLRNNVQGPVSIDEESRPRVTLAHNVD